MGGRLVGLIGNNHLSPQVRLGPSLAITYIVHSECNAEAARIMLQTNCWWIYVPPVRPDGSQTNKMTLFILDFSDFFSWRPLSTKQGPKRLKTAPDQLEYKKVT